jgi:hypothetical protein
LERRHVVKVAAIEYKTLFHFRLASEAFDFYVCHDQCPAARDFVIGAKSLYWLQSILQLAGQIHFLIGGADSNISTNAYGHFLREGLQVDNQGAAGSGGARS